MSPTASDYEFEILSKLYVHFNGTTSSNQSIFKQSYYMNHTFQIEDDIFWYDWCTNLYINVWYIYLKREVWYDPLHIKRVCQRQYICLNRWNLTLYTHLRAEWLYFWHTICYIIMSVNLTFTCVRRNQL